MTERPDDRARRVREAIRDRVKLLLDYRWNGNQRAMSRELGVSQGVISKIVRGSQGAGKRFLAVLARQPGVNSDWVLRGVGQPFPLPTKGTLPVATGILPGPPAAHPELLTGDRHPVAEAFDGPTRYWLLMLVDSPLVLLADLKIAAGDFLLMETATDLTSRDDFVTGRLCAVRERRGEHLTFEWARLVQKGEQLTYTLLFITPAWTSHSGPLKLSHEEFDNLIKKKRRRVIPDDEYDDKVAQERPSRKLAAETAVVKPAITSQPSSGMSMRPDVVGVCLHLDRSFPGSSR